MIGYAMTQTIITLWKQGYSQRAIARLVKKSRDAVNRAIEIYQQGGVAINSKKPTKLEGQGDFILELLEKDLTAIRIHEELGMRGIAVGYSTVKDYVREIKGKHKICVRFHTKAGEEAQIDFGYVGLQLDSQGKRRKAWVFNMRLCYSRLDYYEIVFDQRVETFIKAHIHAFRYFGGVPQVVKIDNLKAAILEANFYEETYQKFYKAFADYYGCAVLPCRVASPQEKGKVEAGIKFVKRNFFAGRTFINKDHMDESLKEWIAKQNNRVHGTTKKVPKELFDKEEKPLLKPLPLQDFTIPEILIRKAGHDCHITVGNNYYSIPYEYVGKRVEVHQDDKLLQIYHEDKMIALHKKCESKGEFITNESHYPKYKNFTPESREYRSLYKQKMQEVGEHASDFFSALLIKEPYNWYRITCGILKLLKLYSKEVVDLACKRALDFQVFKYSIVKNICKTGSYNLPSETINHEVILCKQ